MKSEFSETLLSFVVCKLTLKAASKVELHSSSMMTDTNAYPSRDGAELRVSELGVKSPRFVCIVDICLSTNYVPNPGMRIKKLAEKNWKALFTQR